MNTEPSIMAAAVFTFICAAGSVVMLAATAALWTALIISKRSAKAERQPADRPP